MSHRRNSIVLGGVGVRVLRKGKEVERTIVFHHIFVSVPMTFGDYCRNIEENNKDHLVLRQTDIVNQSANQLEGVNKW